MDSFAGLGNFSQQAWLLGAECENPWRFHQVETLKCQNELKNLRQIDERMMQWQNRQSRRNAEFSLSIAKISLGLRKFRNPSEIFAM